MHNEFENWRTENCRLLTEDWELNTDVRITDTLITDYLSVS